MRGERRRQIAALGAAIGIHLVAAALGGWLLLEHEEQLPPGVVEVAVLGDSGSESGAASGKTGDTVGAGSHFRDMGQNAGTAVTESAGKASPADSTSWRGMQKGRCRSILYPERPGPQVHRLLLAGWQLLLPQGIWEVLGMEELEGRKDRVQTEEAVMVVLPAVWGAISRRMEMVLIPLCLLKGFLTGY